MSLSDYVEHKPVIETDRLIIREMCIEDVPSLREWITDPGICKYWGKGPGKTEKHPELMFEKQRKPVKSFHLGIEEKCSSKIIGDIWVYQIVNNCMASVALRISNDKHGLGYGTEALYAMTEFCFVHTELKRLWTEVDVRNTASIRVLEKCGYKREGTIR